MKIRRRYFSDVKGNPQLQKAVSLALYLKSKLGRSSIITNYTPNKVRTMTGVCQKTFLRYLPLMVEMELVSFAGRHNEHLVINRLSSKTKMRNIDVAKFCYKSFTEVYRSLRAFIVLLIQSRKDYIKRTLQAAHDPKHSDDCKGPADPQEKPIRDIAHLNWGRRFDSFILHTKLLKTTKMRTFNCPKCGLKFKSKTVVKGESRRHFFEEAKCPRCGAKIEIRTDKENEQ